MRKKEISIALLHYLNENNITYALLDTSESYVSGKKDIDFVIAKKDFKNIGTHLNKFCREKNFIIVQTLNHETSARSFVFSYYDASIEKFLDVRTNFYSDFKIAGRFYMRADEFLYDPHYDIEKKHWQISECPSFLHSLIKAIENSSVDKIQFHLLEKKWEVAKTKIQEKLKKNFSEDGFSIVAKSFNEKDFDNLNSRLAHLKQDLHAKTRLRLKDYILERVRLIKNSLRPSGLVIGILGRDGCGKSTFISEITSSLGANFRETNSFKKFPAFFYKTRPKKETFETQKPHYYKERSRLSSFLKLNLLFAEFLFGYWFKIYPLKIKSHLVLFDRYFIDILADPLRYRIKLSRFFIKAYHYLIPQPDLWIIIDLPSDVLLTRKQELSFEMAEKLRYEYLNLQNFLHNSVVINNDQEINKTVAEASAFILNHMQKKIA